MSIKINLKIFIFAVIFYFTKQIEMYAMLMLFAVIHEMGHLICGIVLGLKPKALKIMPFGLSIEFKISTKDFNKKINKGNLLTLKKIAISLAGPITNFLVILICFIFKNKIILENFEYIIYANILIAIFNLIPIYPLDGGRCIKGIVHLLKGRKVAFEVINKISNIFIILLTAISSIAIYYYKNIAILFIIVYLWILVINENKKYNTKMNLYKMIDIYK